MNNFAVFIMVYGRPDRMFTYNTLKKQVYTGKIYLVADNTDETVDIYKEKYGSININISDGSYEEVKKEEVEKENE